MVYRAKISIKKSIFEKEIKPLKVKNNRVQNTRTILLTNNIPHPYKSKIDTKAVEIKVKQEKPVQTPLKLNTNSSPVKNNKDYSVKIIPLKEKVLELENRPEDIIQEIENICYTVIKGPYDTLKEPTFKSEGWRYICFTDQNVVSDVWEIKPIPEELSKLDDIKQQRCLKTQPHKFLPEHEWSVYVDANITVKVGMWKLIKDICEFKDFSVPTHPSNNCIYNERKVCMSLKKDNGTESEKQFKKYQKEGMPEHNGLNETNLLVRKDCNDVRKLDDLWWKEIKNGSHRDQLSFNYCTWKLDYKVNNLNKDIVRKSKYFSIIRHLSN